jgi:hypothetical protein
MSKVDLLKRQAAGGDVHEMERGAWLLSIPAGPAKTYRWAQIDDYMGLARSKFLWQAPVKLALRARVSAAEMPGTWGFGLWNDPFTASFGLGGMSRRLPALPNTAWFFYASPPNYLSLRDDLPARGFMAATFRSARLPAALMALAAPALPLLALKPGARLLRRAARRFVEQSAALIDCDVCAWHVYELDWQPKCVQFRVDGKTIQQTETSPHGPLGLVLWIDNQYAAFSPEGRMAMGSLENREIGWLDIEKVEVTSE